MGAGNRSSAKAANGFDLGTLSPALLLFSLKNAAWKLETVSIWGLWITTSPHTFAADHTEVWGATAVLWPIKFQVSQLSDFCFALNTTANIPHCILS